MPQPWYGQHAPAASAGAIQQHRYHHGVPGQAGLNATNYAAHRGSPTVNRPPSSASTSSTSSYHMHAGPLPPSQSQDFTSTFHSQGHAMHMGNGHHQPMTHSGQGHHSNMQHHMPTARYPMPPRHGSGYMAHSVPGGHMPMRSHHSVAPPANTQPLRQLSGGNGPPFREQHDSAASSLHSQYGPPKSPIPSTMARPINALQVHHPVACRNHTGMTTMHVQSGQPNHPYQHQQYHHQGWNHNPRRSSYPPVTPHHPISAQETNFAHYQRPAYESPETIVDHSSFCRSPSPPPAPTFSQGKTCEGSAPSSNCFPTPLSALVDRRSLAEPSMFKSIGNNAQQQWDSAHVAKENEKPDSPTSNALTKNDAVNEDDDAASILLQLSGVASSHDGTKDADEGRPLSTVHTNNLGSFVSHSAPNRLKAIEASSSIDDDATIATVEGTDCAPDLTSEPSADSIDQNDSEFPAVIPKNYPTRLALKYDDRKLNSLHCFLRSELLEIFVVQKSSQKSPTHSPGSSVGRVGLRCVHCAMIQRSKENREEAPMAVFYPKSISEIYRLVTSWQRCHLRKCRNLPPAVRAQWQSLRDNDKSRGKTHYWITSAKEIGLIDCQSRAGGIRFGPNTKGSETSKEESAVTTESCNQTSEQVDESKSATKLLPEPPATEVLTTVDTVAEAST